jgi:hypothetical protein
LEKRHAPTRWSFCITLFILDSAIVVTLSALPRFLLTLILAIAASPGRPGDTMPYKQLPSIEWTAHMGSELYEGFNLAVSECWHNAITGKPNLQGWPDDHLCAFLRTGSTGSPQTVIANEGGWR